MRAEKRAARIMTWALAAGTAVGITVFGLFCVARLTPCSVGAIAEGERKRPGYHVETRT